MNYGMDYPGGGGGGGGFGGGGGGGGFNSQSQTESGGRARRSYDEQTCIPVTIRMILAAKQSSSDPGGADEQQQDGGGAMYLGGEGGADNRKLSHVRIVGAVRGVEDFSTNIVYKIEDGTGLIEVKQWLDDNACSAAAELRERTKRDNVYVKIIGTVKDYDNSKTLLADSVRPLTTGNELAHHFLEVVYSSEKYKRTTSYVPAPNGMGMMGMGMGMGGGVGFGGPAAVTPMNRGVPLNNNPAAAGSGGGDGLRDTVINMIRNEGELNDEGANVPNCIRQLCSAGNGNNEQEVRKIIEDLASEGHIYSTINEDHYKFAL